MQDSEQAPTKRQPVTGLLAVGAIGVTLWTWSEGGEVGLFTLDVRVWSTQPWRALSSILPHLDVFHLVFNVYWLTVFGTRIEDAYGSLKTAGVYLLLAVGSSFAQHTFSSSGVGLSGVGYGLFGLLFVLQHRDRRFETALGPQVVQLFVFWFFLCVALSWQGMWNVGNVAHGAGAVFGALLGWCVTAESVAARATSRLVFSSSLILILAAAAFGRPYLNFSGELGAEFTYLGWQALKQNDPETAVRLLEQATAAAPAEHGGWFNLGIAYARLERNEDALAAYQRAYELAPSDDGYKRAMLDMKLWLAETKVGQSQDEEAERLYREILEVDETVTLAWVRLAAAHFERNETAEAKKAIARAIALEPDNQDYRAAFDLLNNGDVTQKE